MTCVSPWVKMDEDQTERLIELIHSRPALYDKRLKDYADRTINKALWKEVCEAMIDSWNALTPQEKILKAKEIQQRWQNLRTCFKRELNRSKSGQLSKKRRKYIYYNHLLFLLPTIEGKETSEKALEAKVFNSRTKHRDDTNSSFHVQHTERAKSNSSSYERSILNMLKRKSAKEEIDEDKCFLISLVPSFRKMSDDQKIDAKMEFLSIIRRINQSKSAQTDVDGQIHRHDLCSTAGSLQHNQPLENVSTPTVENSFVTSDNPTPSESIEISIVKIE